MEFLEVIGKRRSIRWFKTWEQVPQEKIQRILEVVRLTTCPGNLQPWRVVVIERDKVDPELRDQLLACDNWQGAHTQAPVWIYFYADPQSARPETFASRTKELVNVGALPNAYGWNAQSIDAAIYHNETMPPGMAAINELLYGLPYEMSANVAYAETVGACAVATLAAFNEGLGACLHMIAAPSKQEEAKRLLGVPEHFVPVWQLLVGYPAEDLDAGGVRPKLPFEQIFSYGKWGEPFPRDERVVEELKAEGVPQPTGETKPNRFDELKFLSRMFGYPV